MSWKALYKKTNYLLLLSVAEVTKLIVRFFIKDAEIFFKRYPLLTSEPKEAWHYFKLCCNDIAQYASLKRPHFFSIAVKLAFSFSVIISISLTSLAKYQNDYQQQTLTYQQEEFSQLLSSEVSNRLKVPLLVNNHLDIKKTIDELVSQTKVINAAVYSDEKNLIYASGENNQIFQNFPEAEKIPSNNNSNLENIIRNLQNLITNTEADRYSILHTTSIKYEHLSIGYLSISFDYSILNIIQIKTLYNYIFITGFFLLIGILLAFYVSRFITKPLIDLLNASDAIHKINANKDKRKHKYKRQDELEVLMESMNVMNKGLLHKDKVEAVFSRYVSEQVAKQVLNDLDNIDKVELGGQHIMASVFFADIVGFTSLSETLDPEEISELLNEYFSKVNEVVSFCGGHVDKFIGDCAMVVFGVPIKNEQHALDCIACGWMVLQLLEQLNQKRQTQGKRTVDFRIGMNSGMMLAGNMGSSERMEYTVVGDSVNLASRLCGTGEPGELIMTEDVFIEQALENSITVEAKDFIKLRGKRLPVKTLTVENILTPFKEQMLAEIPKIIDRTTAK